MAMPHSRQAKSSSNAIDAFQAIMPGSSKTANATASSAQTAVFGANTTIVRVVCTVDCFLVFGSNPTATTSGMYLPAGTVEYFGVEPSTRVAVIRAGSTDGVLYLTEGA